MLYLTCTTITSVDLAHYGVSRAKDWVSVYCGTIQNNTFYILTDDQRTVLVPCNLVLSLPIYM